MGFTKPVPINLKPYQGLKQQEARQMLIDKYVPINLKPYQGLKQVSAVVRDRFQMFQLILNPIRD